MYLINLIALKLRLPVPQAEDSWPTFAARTSSAWRFGGGRSAGQRGRRKAASRLVGQTAQLWHLDGRNRATCPGHVPVADAKDKGRAAVFVVASRGCPAKVSAIEDVTAGGYDER